MTKEQVLEAILALKHQHGRPPTDMELAKMIVDKLGKDTMHTKRRILGNLMSIGWMRQAKFRRERQMLLDLAFNALSHGDIVAVMNYKSKIDSLDESIEKAGKPK